MGGLVPEVVDLAVGFSVAHKTRAALVQVLTAFEAL